MTDANTQRPTIAAISLCSTERVHHLRNQLTALTGQPRVRSVVVWVGDNDPPPLEADRIIHVPPGPDGLRLAAARNAGAVTAIESGAELLVFLDADCIPGAQLFDWYVRAAGSHPRTVLCGPVTYLPSGIDPLGDLAPHTEPHPARPNPTDGSIQPATPAEYPLFWSLSFAVTADAWSRTSGFDERYEGYGGEDTDFAFSLRRDAIPLAWVGGAHAYHQHHPTSSPPWQHLDDILRNGQRFANRWGEWPMTGWLEAFSRAGAVHWDGSTWRRTVADDAGSAQQSLGRN